MLTLYAHGSLHRQLQYVFMPVCLSVCMGLSSSLYRCVCFYFLWTEAIDIISHSNLELLVRMQFTPHTMHVQFQCTFPPYFFL